MFVVSFVLLMVAFIWRKSLYHPKRSAGQEEIDFDVLTLVQHVFLHSPLFYAAFVGALLIGCSIVAFWPSMGMRVP
jgi:hypothetical protein